MSGMDLSQEFKRLLLTGTLPKGVWASEPQRSDVTGRVVARVKITSLKLRYDLGMHTAHLEIYYRDLPIGRFTVPRVKANDVVKFDCKTLAGGYEMELSELLSIK